MALRVEENKIIFTRKFNTTKENIFKPYTEQDLFEKWFHPEGATLEVFEFNVETGGKAFFAIKAPEATSYTVAQYKRVEAPYLIDYYDYFADEQGNIDQNMDGMHNTIRLIGHEDNSSTVESVAELPDAEAAQKLLDMGVEAGMNSTFDNLEKLVQKEFNK